MRGQSYDLGPLWGAAFVGLVLVANSMSQSGTAHAVRPTGEQVLADLAVVSSGVVNRIGLALELGGFTAFAVFLAYLYGLLARRGRADGAAALALVAGTLMLAVKLGSAGPYLLALADHDRLSPELALALTNVNGVAFVVAWLPLALFVGAAAVALHRAALVGRVLFWSGLVIGLVGLPVAALTALNPYSNFAGTFLLSLIWIVAVSLRLAWVPASAREVRTPVVV